jgi:hypothetical protein
MKRNAAGAAPTPNHIPTLMLVLLILVGAVMLVVESGAWIPPRKEPAKPDEKKGVPLPATASDKR